MSAEDLEIQHPADAPVNRQYLPLQGSLVNGLDSFLHRGKGVLRSGSLPFLMDILSHPNEEDEADEGETDATCHKEQDRVLVTVAVEQKD